MQIASLELSLALAAQASIQDPPELMRLAEYVRWGGVFLSIFVIAGAYIVLRVVARIAAELSQRFVHQRMLIQKLESVGQFAIYVLASLLVLGLSVRLDARAIALIGGALAFAVGFAMRDVVAAFIAGIIIIFDRPFQVGDRIHFAGEYGDILRIGLRSVRMVTLDGAIVTIPNNKVLTDVTASANYGELETIVHMDFYVGADQDIALASRLVEEACLTSRYCYLERPVVMAARQVIVQNYIAFLLTARPHVLDVKYELAFQTDVHVRVQRAFRERGVLLPAVLHRNLESETAPSTL